jgi:hypothetical protein
MFARFRPSCFPITLWKANRAVFGTKLDPGSSHPNQCAVERWGLSCLRGKPLKGGEVSNIADVGVSRKPNQVSTG